MLTFGTFQKLSTNTARGLTPRTTPARIAAEFREPVKKKRLQQRLQINSAGIANCEAYHRPQKRNGNAASVRATNAAPFPHRERTTNSPNAGRGKSSSSRRVERRAETNIPERAESTRPQASGLVMVIRTHAYTHANERLLPNPLIAARRD